VGPTAHHLDVPRPAEGTDGPPVPGAGGPGAPDSPNPARRRSRGGGVLPPGRRPPPASGQGRGRSRGVRVHRGEPLLL